MIRRFPVDKIKLMNGDIAIIDNTPKGRTKNGLNYGLFDVMLTQEHIDALSNGKSIALNLDGEYVAILNKSLDIK